MSLFLTALFNRRAELLEHLSTLDTMIMLEGQKYLLGNPLPPSITDSSHPAPQPLEPIGLAIPPFGYEPYTHLPDPAKTGIVIPKGITMKATVIHLLKQASAEGYTVREIKDIINAANGAGSAKNIDQVVIGLIKAGQARSHNNPGKRNSYSLIAKESKPASVIGDTTPSD